MHLACSTPSMLRLNSSSSLFFSTVSKTLIFFSRHRPQNPSPNSSRTQHSAPLLVSLKQSSSRKRPNAPPPPPPPPPSKSAPDSSHISRKAMLKARRESPEGILRHKLDMCSRRGDLLEALRLYDEARAQSVTLSQHHYNVLLYLCTSPPPTSSCDEPVNDSHLSPEIIQLGVDRGFEIFEQMNSESVPPNEATFTSLARLAAAKRDPDLAFKVIEEMSKMGIPPKLRSYGPAVFGFCTNGNFERAFEVEAHMGKSGVLPEEEELAALLKVSVKSGKDEHVYRLLHRLRVIVRQVSSSTAEIVEEWFNSEVAEEIGGEEWDREKVKEGVVNGGGGWHGQGWLGKGRWTVGRTEMSESGECRMCGEKLISIDIDPLETENFAKSLATLASQREVRADFNRFQDWLDRHGPFDAVIDGANVGLANQHHFSFFQLNSVVNGIRKLSPTKKLPLVILHSRRVKEGPADSPNNKKLLESWKRSGALYSTPPGSNDDWYWLYAAVSCRSLLVTNDEMRDHLFQLLGTSFFPRWKEKHQVRMKFSKSGMSFHMPPPYSIVIQVRVSPSLLSRSHTLITSPRADQESEVGSWHVPTIEGDDIDSPRQWVCASRTAAESFCM